MGTQKNKAYLIAKRIKELPPLPLTVQKLLQVVRDEKTSAKDVGKVLSADQVLTGKVLKLVNSSFYGFPGKISTVTRAVVILGFAEVKNLAMGLSAYGALEKYRDSVDWQDFWSHSITCAAGAQALASRSNYPIPEEAFVAGLLHDIGQFVISLTFPDEYPKVLESREGTLIEREKETLGMSHTEVGMELFEHWKLPEKLSRVARLHHSAELAATGKEPLVTLVMIADALACAKGYAFTESISIDVLGQLTKVMGIPVREYKSILTDMDKRIEEAKVFLRISDGQTQSGQIPPAETELGMIAVVGSEEDRIVWVKTLLEHFGYPVLFADSLSELTIDSESLQLVLVDSKSAPENNLKNLRSLSKENGVPMALLKDAEEEPKDKRFARTRAPTIPTVFSQKDIVGLLKEHG